MTSRKKLRVPKVLVWTALGSASLACSSGTSTPVTCQDCLDSAIADRAVRDHELTDHPIHDASTRDVERDVARSEAGIADRNVPDVHPDGPREAAVADRSVPDASPDGPREAAIADQGVPEIMTVPDALLG